MAQWHIPTGLTQGTWDYVCGHQIAEGYDHFLHQDPLATFEEQILTRFLPTTSLNSKGPVVVDFGAGTGRSLIPVVKRGYRGLAIDLSIPMLTKLCDKLALPQNTKLDLVCVQANLVELNCFRDGVAQHGLCLFSTLGMIQSNQLRLQFLKSARRMIADGGLFIVHAHNYWYQMTHPGGIGWAISNVIQRLRRRAEIGDRTSDYRGIRDLYIHSFRRRELTQLLLQAGFTPQTVIPVRSDQTHWRTRMCRTVGWIVVCD